MSYDAERNTLFLNFEGMHVRTRDDVDRVRRVVEERCQAIGSKVALVVNYDDFRHRRRGGRHLRRDGPLHGDALLHDGLALHDQRLPAR